MAIYNAMKKKPVNTFPHFMDAITCGRDLLSKNTKTMEHGHSTDISISAKHLKTNNYEISN